MKFFIDTEFHEYQKTTGIFRKQKTDTIELISIGIVAENGKEYYAICNEFDLAAAWENEWLRENVLKSIHSDLMAMEGTYTKTYHCNLVDFSLKGMGNLLKWHGKTKQEIRWDIIKFIGTEKPDFYGYYCDYDWVIFCWLFGRMIDLPGNFPMFCIDLRQMMEEAGLTKEWKEKACPAPDNEHNALADAKWNMSLCDAIKTHTAYESR